MSEFERYRRSAIAELRPYVPGEPVDGVSISDADRAAGSPMQGDMIARNPDNYADRWLVAAKYFAANFEPAEAKVDSAGANRTANNAVRHAYRLLTDDEKVAMVAIKDMGAEFLTLIQSCGASRELSIAATKIEEAVMWAVKHGTK